jgi:copper chaperone CopZ
MGYKGFIMTTTFHAPDIECDGCAASIRKALSGQPGIEQVTVSVPDKTVTVQFNDAVTQARIAEQLDEIGFPAKVA